jgi:hypothetical protein
VQECTLAVVFQFLDLDLEIALFILANSERQNYLIVQQIVGLCSPICSNEVINNFFLFFFVFFLFFLFFFCLVAYLIVCRNGRLQ